MTPNKLPPLPALVDRIVESAMKIHCPEGKWLTGPATFSMVIAEELASGLESLRQSQSLPAGDDAPLDDELARLRKVEDQYRALMALPAGAVAVDLEDLVHKLCDRAFGDGLDNRDTYSGHTQVLRRKLIEGIAALQADAREKGEAPVAWWNGEPDSYPVTNRELAEKLGYIWPLYERPACGGNEAMAMHWIERYAAGIDDEPQMDRIREALATHPAQASEAEWHRVLFRYALNFITAEGDDDDLFFHHNGKWHSLNASITAAIAKSSQETASE